MYKTVYNITVSNFISISSARANLPKLIDQINEGSERITISVNGKPKAVLVSQEELDALEETAGILSIPGAKKAIKTGLRQAKLGQGIPLSQLE